MGGILSPAKESLKHPFSSYHHCSTTNQLMLFPCWQLVNAGGSGKSLLCRVAKVTAGEVKRGGQRGGQGGGRETGVITVGTRSRGYRSVGNLTPLLPLFASQFMCV